MKRFLFDCGTRDPLASSGLLALRLPVSLMMLLGHGLPKWQNFDQLKPIFAEMVPLPWVSAAVTLSACILAEVLAPILLILGLATRPAAFLLGFAMVVAAFHVHQGDPWILAPGVPGAKEPALLYLIPMLVLIISGAGSWSADAALYEEKRRRRHW